MIATYRLQLHRHLTLKSVLDVVDFLHKLGISHLYLSPILKARKGSLHGYDVVDPWKLNNEIGSEKDLSRLVRELKQRGMGLILDIVPNHMAADEKQNKWWGDVIQKGKQSRYAHFFDIDWEASQETLIYRRFFDLGEFVALRMEDSELFTSYHQKILSWVHKKWISGLRIDHPDGLRDPLGYLQQLKKACRSKKSFPVLVEKILEDDEELRSDWPVAGSTGYDYLNLLNGLFVDRSNERKFLSLYRHFSGERDSWNKILRDSKRYYIQSSMAQDLDRLVRVAERYRLRKSIPGSWSREEFREALSRLISIFPVYRSYIAPAGAVSVGDRQLINATIREVKKQLPKNRSLSFLKKLLLASPPDREFVLRFQQLTAPVMAKGLEDTALYRFFPLASLNEVGGSPGRFGISIDSFHQKNRERLRNWPWPLLATSTHDTKRSEDVRARINVLSEIPDKWFRYCQKWHRWNRRLKLVSGGRSIPTQNDEYLLYQTLVGTWPNSSNHSADTSYISRIEEYMIKSVREAKLETNWTNPNEIYEQAVRRFVRSLLDRKKSRRFLDSFVKFLKPVQHAGWMNSLAQTLLKMTSPGIPDFYQGTELCNLSLVDPDNRRPVDFELRKNVCDSKLHLIATTLRHRKIYPDLYLRGKYLPLRADRHSNHIIAFARSWRHKNVIIVVRRFWMHRRFLGDPSLLLSQRLAGNYQDLSTGVGVSTFKNGSQNLLSLKDVLSRQPIALLEMIREEKRHGA